MKKSECFQEFARYAFLNVLGMLGLSCYILADTYFVSRGLGANGLTALNLAIPVYSFIHGSGLMIGMGGGTRYSMQKSLGRCQKTDQLFTNAVRTAAVFAVFYMCIGIFGTDLLVTLLGADTSVFAMTRTYLKMILLFSPAFLMNNVFLCFIRNDGAPQLSMRAMLGGSFSNVLLDYIFIFPCHMGIFGAAFATCLAPVISFLMLSPHLLKKNNQFHFIRCSLDRKQILDILASGIPPFVTEVSSGIVMILFNTVILELQGNIGVAAYGVIANLSLVVTSIYNGVAQGIQPITARHYGAGEQEQVRKILRYALTSMLCISMLIYAGTFIWAPQISGAFNKEQNEVLQRIAVEGLKLYFTACPFVGFNIIISTYFTSTANPLPANLISVLRGFVIIIPLTFLFSAIWRMAGIWCVFPCTEWIVSMIGILFYGIKKKRI